MFIGRRPDGTIYGVWGTRQRDDEFHPGMEEVANDDPELLTFLAPDAGKVAEEAKLSIDLGNVRATNQVVAFLQMSPAEIDAYIEANITGGNASSITAIKTILSVLAKVVAVTARRSISS